MIFQTLNGKWVMNERGSEAFVEAQVPGSVLSALLVGHRTNDPLFGINEEETRQLIQETLTPIGYNFMVTPKEIDFIIQKLCDIIGNGLNESLHKKIK